LLGVHSEKVARAYLDANLEGQQWLLRYCSDPDPRVGTSW